MKVKKIQFIAILIIVLFLFYQYDLKPANIRKTCNEISEKQIKEVLYRDYYNRYKDKQTEEEMETIQDNINYLPIEEVLAYPIKYDDYKNIILPTIDFLYQRCLNENGLIK